MKSTYGEHMRIARDNVNLKQVDVREKIGISNQNLSKWENGDAEPCIEDSIKLADLYGITLDELFGHKPTGIHSVISGRLTTVETRVIIKMRSLNNEGQLKALEYVDDLSGNIKYTEKEAISI